MTKVIEFNIPTGKGVEPARGIPVWLKVGERKIRFVLQHDNDGKVRSLTHFASGYKFGSLDDAAVELMCKFSPYHRFTKKQLAEFLINKAVTRFGAGEVLEKLDAAPIVNI